MYNLTSFETEPTPSLHSKSNTATTDRYTCRYSTNTYRPNADADTDTDTDKDTDIRDAEIECL